MGTQQLPIHKDGSGPLVLVVDDNPAIRDMVRWSLELHGYGVVEAEDGYKALAWMEKAAQDGCYPAVILLDLSMPVMDGGTFLQRLAANWAPLHPVPAVIVITAAESRDIPRTYVKQVVIKPFRVRDLLEVIRKLVA